MDVATLLRDRLLGRRDRLHRGVEWGDHFAGPENRIPGGSHSPGAADRHPGRCARIRVVLGPILLKLNPRERSMFRARRSPGGPTEHDRSCQGPGTSALPDQKTRAPAVSPSGGSAVKVKRSPLAAFALGTIWSTTTGGSCGVTSKRSLPPSLHRQARSRRRWQGRAEPRRSSTATRTASGFNTNTGSGLAGKYLVDAQGRAMYLVDPGINGVFTIRPDGTTATKFNPTQATLMSY